MNLSKESFSKFQAGFSDLIKTCFGDNTPAEAKKSVIKTGFAEASLPDGSILTWQSEGDSPMQNEPVMVLLPTGETLPAPTGTYELETGAMITVTDGVVTAVVPKKTEAAPEATADATGAPPMDMSAPQAKAIVESITKETRFSEVVVEIFKAEFAAQLAALKTELVDAMKAEFTAQLQTATDSATAALTTAEKAKNAVEVFSSQAVKLMQEMTQQPEEKQEEKEKSKPEEKTFEQKVQEFRAGTFNRS